MRDIISESANIKNSIHKITEEIIDRRTRACMRLYKAVVTTAPSAGKCSVQLVGHSKPYSLPYSNAVANAGAGDTVWVASLYDSFSSAFVFARYNFNIPISSSGGQITVYPGYTTSVSSSSAQHDITLYISDNFALDNGIMVCVQFLTSGLAANGALNVNGTGAVPIFPTSTTVPIGQSAMFMYRANRWYTVAAGGQDGVGIQSVEQTTTSTADSGTNVITVTLTDGTQSTFDVKNGSRGSTGPQGEPGQDGAAGSPGTDGATFTPSVSDDGIISWTNDGGLPNPDPVNILGNISEDVAQLQAQMNNITKYVYVCNGSTDNVELTNIAQTFLANDTAYDNMTVYVCGTFGATSPVGGSGTSSARYVWMNLGAENAGMKRLTFDFENCSQITLNCQSGYYYYGIGGAGINFRNANIVAKCNYETSSIILFETDNAHLYCENCSFVINGSASCYIAETGTFDNCNATVINTSNSSRCFYPSAQGLLRINGGEYYAYTGMSNRDAAVIESSITTVNAVIITNNMNCPTVARDGLYQKNAVNCVISRGAINNTITQLEIATNTSTMPVVNTVAGSKPGL